MFVSTGYAPVPKRQEYDASGLSVCTPADLKSGVPLWRDDCKHLCNCHHRLVRRAV